MLVNQNTILIGQRVVLVPYRPEHVAIYHGWRANPELLKLQLTADDEEALTLEDEHRMQEQWREDECNLTFIIHARTPEFRDDATATSVLALPMVGDVNLFLKRFVDPEDENCEAEVQVMVAEPAYRQKGMAMEALQLLLSYSRSSRIA